MVAMILLLCLAVGGMVLLMMLVFPPTRGAALGVILVGVVAALALAVIVGHRRFSATSAPQASQSRPPARKFHFNFQYRRQPVAPRPHSHAGPGALAEVAVDDDFAGQETVSAGAQQGKPWVGSEPDYDGDVHKIAVSSGYFDTNQGCMDALEQDKIIAAIDEYIGWFLRHRASPPVVRFEATASEVPLVQRLDSEIEQREFTWGAMQQAHVLLGFDEQFRDHLERRARDAVIADRLTKTGVASGGVLMLLTSVWGFLKLRLVARDKAARIMAVGTSA